MDQFEQASGLQHGDFERPLDVGSVVRRLSRIEAQLSTAVSPEAAAITMGEIRNHFGILVFGSRRGESTELSRRCAQEWRSLYWAAVTEEALIYVYLVDLSSGSGEHPKFASMARHAAELAAIGATRAYLACAEPFPPDPR